MREMHSFNVPVLFFYYHIYTLFLFKLITSVNDESVAMQQKNSTYSFNNTYKKKSNQVCRLQFSELSNRFYDDACHSLVLISLALFQI